MKKTEKIYKRQLKNFKFYCRNNRRGVILMALVILISFSAISAVKVRAGSLTPSSAPAASGYTLGDIYTRLATNAAATAGNHTLATTTSPAASFYTLTQIYNAIPTIYAGDLLASSTYLGVTGTVEVKTGNTAVASSSAQGTSLVFTIPQGYYDGTDTVTVATTSAVFIAGNIASGVNLFGLVGTLLGYAYGGDSIDQVLTTATGTPGTYDPSNLIAINVKSGITFGTSTTGSLLPSGGTATPADVTSGKTFFGSSQSDWNLQTGTASVIDYSLWNLQTIDDWICSGATSCTGKTEYTAEEGSWSNVAGSPFNAGFATSSAPLNYYPVGTNIYLASGQVKQDNRTGLWWSDAASTGAVTAVATSTSNDFYLAGAAGVGDGTRPWDTGTTTATNGNAINFCNALNAISFAGYTDWYLPTQKELMQAYINGAANNSPNAGYVFWSSTEAYSDPAYAWRVALYYGYTNYYAKTNSYYVRCVRR